MLALVPAAGDGVRLGAGMPKALVPVGGIPLVARAVQGLLRSGAVDHVVVAVREADLGLVGELFVGEPAVDVVVGGVDRTASVGAALRQGECRHPDAEIVLVHDAARALTPPAMIASLVAAVVDGFDAVVPVLPVADTVKQVGGDGVVVRTADRSTLRAVQTPQAFRISVLRRAYAAAPAAVTTDDAGLVEMLGEPVHTVPGDPLAFKVTTPWDLRVAEYLVTSSVAR